MVAEIIVTLDVIEAHKVGEVSPHDPPQYKLETLTSKMEERTSERAVLRFSFTIETQPKVVTFLASGRAVARGTEGEVEVALTSSSERPPEILQRIFQENLVTFYLLSKAMGVHPPKIPLPWGEVKP